MCVCYPCVYEGAVTYIYKWSPEINVRCIHLCLSTLYIFRQGFSLNQELIVSARLASWQGPGICLSLSPCCLHWGYRHTAPGFYVGVRDPNSGSQACMTSTLLFEPSSQFQSPTLKGKDSLTSKTCYSSLFLLRVHGCQWPSCLAAGQYLGPLPLSLLVSQSMTVFNMTSN